MANTHKLSEMVDGTSIVVDLGTGKASTPAAAALGAHEADTANPHSVTAAQAGAVPTSRVLAATAPLQIAGGASADLSADRTLSVSAASTSAQGVVQLEDSTSSTSTTKAATPNSVKTAYDRASFKNLAFNATQTGTSELVVGAVHLLSTDTIRGTSRAQVGGATSAHSAVLRLRRTTTSALVASWTVALAALTDRQTDGAADIPVPATDWYDITLSGSGAADIALCKGLRLDL